MIEWEDDERSQAISTGIWKISWDNVERANFPINPSTRDQINRLYFLLSTHDRIPGTIALSLTPSDASESESTWKVQPLPAIFPPSLGASAREKGKKGVLHTIWAKRRLQTLANEEREELGSYAESEALTMIRQEREWIEANFGVVTKIKEENNNKNTSPKSTESITVHRQKTIRQRALQSIEFKKSRRGKAYH